METIATSAGVRTFLIADIRGYTRFTLERGDEAAARLTAHFAELAQEVVAARDGQVIELRGDEALAVFSSARQALRAAVDLQRRTGQETKADTILPLKLGIGLDAGEAIPLEGGYRGAALNLAARLCALAGPGEVLSSEAVTHLARKVEGLEYSERGLVQLKGFSDAVKVIQVLPETQHQRPEQTSQLHGTYRVQLLGPFALLRDDGVIDTSRWQRRVGSLLKLLLTAPGKRCIWDELIDLLWPEASPETGGANLRLLTYRVRQALGNPDPPAVLSDRSWVTINPRYHWEVDLDRFEELAAGGEDDIAKLEEAASLYRGEPLPEDRYDDWAMPIRERIQRRWREVCLRLAARYRADGSSQQAVDRYERILQSDPLDEEATQGLLSVLVDLGKRTEALRRYRQFEQRLAQELDLPPQPETLALVQRIEDRITQPVPQPESGGTERMRELVPVIPTYPLPIAGPLIGREAELQEVLAALPDEDSAQTPGSPGAASVRLVLLAAEAGLGKTRLLAEVARRARERGLLTLAGGSYEQEGKLPYGPIHDALLDYIRAQPDEVLTIQLEGLIAELARIIPELRAHIPDIGEPPMSDPESQRLRLFSTVAQALERISQDSPLVLLLDDLHWADEATLQLLHFLLRQPVLSRVLMVGAYRREEIAEETALAQLTGEAERAPLAKTLTPSPLKEAELAALISERLGRSCSEDLVSTLHERSAGNPFFAVQMLRLLQQEGRLVETEAGWKLAGGTAVELPTEIRKTIARRLRGLPTEGREALTLGAVLGREFGHVQLEALWEGNERSLFAALDTALTAQVLTETEEGHAFAHPLLWEVVHDRVPARRRRRLHQKAGLELEMRYGQEAEEHAAELAWHFRQGDDSHRSLRYALLAGERAANLNAGTEATQYYRMALELARRVGTQQQLAQSLFGLGSAQRVVGSLDEALPLFEEAAELYQTLSDPVLEARSLAFVADVQSSRERLEETVQSLERVEQLLDSIGTGTPSPELESAYRRLGVVHTDMGRYSEALVDLGRAAEVAKALGDERLLIWTELFRFEVLWDLGRIEDVSSEAERLLRRAGSLGDSLAMRVALACAAEAATYAGNFEQGWEYRRRALAVEERIPSPLLMVSTLGNLAWQARLRGEWEVARDHIQQALDLDSSTSSVRSERLLMLQRGTLALWQGDWDLASHLLEESVSAFERLSLREVLRYGQAALAELHLLQGQPEAAARRLEPVLDRPGFQEFDVTPLLPILAWAYLEMGEVGRAEQVVAEGTKRALAQQNRLALVDALRVQGMVLTQQGRWQEAKQAFEEAVSLPQTMPYPYAEARARYEWGMMLVRNGEPGQARELLEEAAVIFRRLGANKDIDRTEQALAQVDER